MWQWRLMVAVPPKLFLKHASILERSVAAINETTNTVRAATEAAISLNSTITEAISSPIYAAGTLHTTARRRRHNEGARRRRHNKGVRVQVQW